MAPMLTTETLIILLLTLVVVTFAFLHHSRALAGRFPLRRPIAAFDIIRAALGRGAETGRALHISPGAGTIGSGMGYRATTTETIAGLLAVEAVANEAAMNGAPILVSSGDAVAHIALLGSLRQVYQRAGHSQDYDPARVQLLAHQDELAYATGVTTLYARQPIEASQMIGSFGQAFLLMGEDGAQRDIPQLTGATAPDALALMMVINPKATLIGEEVYAAEAYLSSASVPQARLMTHDALRTTLILLIIGGIVYSLLQPTLGLPPLPSL